MLYRLSLEAEPGEALVPIGFLDLSEVGKAEKDLEDILAANLFKTLYEEAGLLPVRQERRGEALADIYAVNEHGDLVIFELKRSGAGSGALAQALRYAADASRFSYDKLNSWYQDLVESPSKNLDSEHKEAFSHDACLPHSDFNRRQSLRLVGSAADQELVNAVDYWKRQGIDIDFVPYRLYRLDEGLFFEFFSLPYDQHHNPACVKGVLFDTNARWDPNSVWEMIDQEKVAAWGDVKHAVDVLNPRDIVFLYHVGHGVIAAAEVLESAAEGQPDERFCRVKFLTDTPSRVDVSFGAMPAREVKAILDQGFYWARTVKVPYLSRQQSEMLLAELRASLSNRTDAL